MSAAGRSCGVVAALILSTLAGASQEPPEVGAEVAWSGDFVPGRYPVGFRHRTLTREGSEGSRELALSIWYPAAADEGEPVRVRDYFREVLREGELTEAVGLQEDAAFAAALTGSPDALSPERARAGLDAAGMARWQAPPAAGSFPVALWSSRHATLLAQAPLSEVLASYGFVVVTVWSSDPPLAFVWEDEPVEAKLATIASHTRDLVRGLEEVRRESGVGGSDVVVLAWSYGGQTAARLQEREASVRGVIALDANVLPSRPEESLELRRPLLYLVGRDTANRGYERLRSLTTPWIAVRFTELSHGSFNALEGYLPATLGAENVYPWAQAGTVARDGYRALVRVVVAGARELTGGAPDFAASLSGQLATAAGNVSIEVFARAGDAPGGPE